MRLHCKATFILTKCVNENLFNTFLISKHWQEKWNFLQRFLPLIFWRSCVAKKTIFLNNPPKYRTISKSHQTISLTYIVTSWLIHFRHHIGRWVAYQNILDVSLERSLGPCAIKCVHLKFVYVTKLGETLTPSP